MQKKMKPVHMVLLSLALVVLIFLVWSVFPNPYPNQYDAEHISNKGDAQVHPKLQPSSSADMLRDPTPAPTVPIDKVHVDGQPKSADVLTNSTGTRSQPTEHNKMNQEQQLTHAKNDLAGRLTINIDEIHSQGVQRVTWRSSATGCPKPGRSYMQVMVPGVLIKLQVNGVEYRYHATTSGRPFYCPAGQAETPAPSQDGALE